MNRIRFLIFLATFIITIISAAGQQAGSVFDGDWSNPNRDTPENIFAFRKLTYPFENQTSLWVARFDDGSYFYGYIFNYKFSIIEKWGVTAVLIDPDGSRHIGKAEIPRDDVKYSLDSIDFSSNAARQSGRQATYKFLADTEKFYADLTYENLVPSFVPGGGIAWYDSQKKIFLKNCSHCPWGKVSGTIKVDGKTRKVNGQGYADRDHANQLFTKQIKELHTFRGWPEDMEKGLSVAVSEYISGPQYGGLRAIWLIVMKKGEIIMATRNFNITRTDFATDDLSGFEYPEKWSLEAHDSGKSLTGSWSSSKLIDVLDVINEIPAPLRPIARRFFTRPVFYRMKGTFNGVFNDGSKQAPVEIEGLYKAVYTK